MDNDSRQAGTKSRDTILREIPNPAIYVGLGWLHSCPAYEKQGHEADVDFICGLYAAMRSAELSFQASRREREGDQ